jgi:hypothetical protein
VSKGFVRFQSRAGNPIKLGTIFIVPRSRTLQIILPFWAIGCVANWPELVEIYDENGQVKKLPIWDVTRLWQMAFLLGSFLFVGITWLLLKPRAQKREAVLDEKVR